MRRNTLPGDFKDTCNTSYVYLVLCIDNAIVYITTLTINASVSFGYTIIVKW